MRSPRRLTGQAHALVLVVSTITTLSAFLPLTATAARARLPQIAMLKYKYYNAQINPVIHVGLVSRIKIRHSENEVVGRAPLDWIFLEVIAEGNKCTPDRQFVSNFRATGYEPGRLEIDDITLRPHVSVKLRWLPPLPAYTTEGQSTICHSNYTWSWTATVPVTVFVDIPVLGMTLIPSTGAFEVTGWKSGKRSSDVYASKTIRFQPEPGFLTTIELTLYRR